VAGLAAEEAAVAAAAGNMQAKILRQSAVMFASDLPKTIAFWNEKAGFATHATFLDPPRFAIMERDSAFVMLRQAATGQTIVPYSRLGEGLWNAYFWVDDVEALFAELRGRAAPLDYELCDQPYGVREFAIKDPDGQGIGFGQVLGTATGAPPT
jgi:catechol 2,3-dioxygenase-like lactoylglutathione lyase family enzyme